MLISSAFPSTADITTGPCDANVGNGWRTNVFHTAVVTSTGAEIVEQSFTATEQDRHNRNVHFIDQRSTKVLPDGGCATSHQDITVTGRFEGCSESFFDPAVDEMEGCSPLHFDRSMRLVSEHEDRVTKRRILSPPSVQPNGASVHTNEGVTGYRQSTHAVGSSRFGDHLLEWWKPRGSSQASPGVRDFVRTGICVEDPKTVEAQELLARLRQEMQSDPT